MICANCGKREAIYDQVYGWLPCYICQDSGSDTQRENIEFTSDDIKEQRKAYSKDILQPHRKGVLSNEYLKVYGKEAARKRGFSEKEIAHAHNVWDGYYND